MVELSKAQKLEWLEATAELFIRRARAIQEKYDLAVIKAGESPVPDAVTKKYKSEMADCSRMAGEARDEWLSTKAGTPGRAERGEDPFFGSVGEAPVGGKIPFLYQEFVTKPKK